MLEETVIDMLNRKLTFALCAVTSLIASAGAPVSAHVKWFLKESQAKLLSQPKPELFTTLSVCNSLVFIAAIVSLYLLHKANKRFQNARINTRMTELAEKHGEFIGLCLGVCTGIALIKCYFDTTYFVPSMHLHSCCHWVAQVELAIGLGLILGVVSRPCGAAMLFLLGWGFFKFSTADCTDLLPMYGLAFYFLIAGRGKWSIDSLLKITRELSPLSSNTGILLLRWSVGFGLIGLGCDEKLLHPQLALALLQQKPGLNLLHAFGMGNALFVLCAGLFEVSLGLMLISGIFPRLAILFLASLFTVTTWIFGSAEFFGHMPYYGMVVAILFRPVSVYSIHAYCANAQESWQRWLLALQHLKEHVPASLSW